MQLHTRRAVLFFKSSLTYNRPGRGPADSQK